MTNGSSQPVETRPPRRRRKGDRPGEIIAAGLAEFGARGFEAARMEDVARRAGVAKGTLFLYFPTKEALFEAALLSRVSPVHDGVVGAVERHEGPSLDLVRLMVSRFYGELARPEVGTLMRIIIAEGPRFPAILESWHRLSIARAQDVLGRIVARGVASGEFRESAATGLPMVLLAPALMAAIWRMTFDRLQPVSLEEFRAAHLAVVTAALTGGAADDPLLPPGEGERPPRPDQAATGASPPSAHRRRSSTSARPSGRGDA